MDLNNRAKLAMRIYDLVYENTESFEGDNIGSALAYLMGAILKNGTVQIDDPPSNDPSLGSLWNILVKHLDNEDIAFDYLDHYMLPECEN